MSKQQGSEVEAREKEFWQNHTDFDSSRARAVYGIQQHTSAEFTALLINNDIDISMDGRGAWRDNVFVERFWRTIKYEEVYPRL